MKEQWKAIPGLEEYEASDQGHIRKRGYTKIYDDGTKVEVKPEFVSIYEHSTHSMYLLINGHTYMVHRLVALAWLSPVGDASFVRHLDGDKTNNAVSNLIWSHTSCEPGKIKVPSASAEYGTHGKGIKVVETEQVFFSMKAASTYFGIPYSKFLSKMLQEQKVTIDGKTLIRTSEAPNVTQQEVNEKVKEIA